MPEHRQQFGERDRCLAPVHPHPPVALDVVDMTSQRRSGGLVGVDQLQQPHEVADRVGGRDTRPVRLGRGVTHPGHEMSARRLAQLMGRRDAEPVDPRGGELVDQRRHVVEIGFGAGRACHGERDPGEIARPEERIDLDRRRAVRLTHQCRHLLGQPGVEALPRHVHEHGRPVADGLRHVEDAHDLALLESDHVDHELGQRVGVELEHEVARERLEHVPHRPPRVRLGSGLGQPEHGPRPIADRRDREHALPVGGGRQQTDEAIDDGLAVDLVHHRHHGHSCRAMDRSAFDRAGDRHRWAVERQRRVERALDLELTQGAVRDDGGTCVRHGVRGGAEEHEMSPGQPLEQRIEPGEIRHPIAHRCEVGHHTVDEVDRGPEVGRQQLAVVAVTTVDLDLRPGLDHRPRFGTADDVDQRAVGVAPDVEHRVHQQMGRDGVPLEHDADRLDQERGIVGDEQHDGALGRPTVAIAIR